MKSVTYKKLMAKIAANEAEVNAWSGDFADVTFFPANLSKPAKRETVFVSNVPKDMQ